MCMCANTPAAPMYPTSIQQHPWKKGITQKKRTHQQRYLHQGVPLPASLVHGMRLGNKQLTDPLMQNLDGDDLQMTVGDVQRPNGPSSSEPDTTSMTSVSQEEHDTYPETTIYANEKPTLGTGNWFSTRLGVSKIRVFNGLTVFIHLLMLLVAIGGRYTRSTQIYELKYDRIHAVVKPRPGSLSGNINIQTQPLLSIISPYTGSKWANSSSTSATISETCALAQPNTLDFAGSTNISIALWTYPRNANMPVDLGWCVIMFFMLSFLFQGSMEIMTLMKTSPLDYQKMLDPESYSDVEDWNNKANAHHMSGTGSHVPLVECLSRELHCNQWRFVEYSGSGSLIIFTIALFAGIVDIELLMCMFFMSFICMILGIVAEFALRAKVVLKEVVHYLGMNSYNDFRHGGLNYSDDNSNHPVMHIMPIIQAIYSSLTYIFWMCHVLGWLGIMIPWIIIITRYNSWYSPCGADSLRVPRTWLNATADADNKAAMDSSKPPDELVIIVWLEFVLYMSFGAVQFFQGLYGKGWVNRKVEVAYIALSAVAKFLLGSILFANVIFT